MKLEKEEFDKRIHEVDSKLAEEKIAIPGRPLQAIISMFQSHKVSGPLIHSFGKDMSFPITATNLSDHVNAWYEINYGNMIKIDPSPGRFPLLIEGATYQCRLPLLMGSHMILASKEKFQDKKIINAVDYISDLPTHVRARMSGSFENIIQAIFLTCLEVTSDLKNHTSQLLKSASTDIQISCDLISGYNVNPSLSAWHSLQFAEKTLKEYISRFVKPPFSHNICELVELAQSHGYKLDDRLNLNLFKFGASVRYDPTQIPTEGAISINHESWRIAFNVLKQIPA